MYPTNETESAARRRQAFRGVIGRRGADHDFLLLFHDRIHRLHRRLLDLVALATAAVVGVRAMHVCHKFLRPRGRFHVRGDHVVRWPCGAHVAVEL